MNIEEAKKFFSKDIYATETTGIEILEVKPHFAKCRLVLCKKHLNAAGQIMGGVIYTLADFSFAVASNIDEDSPTVTLSSTVNYLSSVKGSVLFSETTLQKDGKRSCFYTTNITDDKGTLIAVVTTNGMHMF